MTNQQKALIETAKVVGIISLLTLAIFAYSYIVTPMIFGLTFAVAIASYCIWIVYTVNLSKIERDEEYKSRQAR